MKYVKKLNILKKDNKGFSLLELVVAVGVLLVLTVLGLLSYNGITNNARQTAVNKAAADVIGSVISRNVDSKYGKAMEAGEDWENSASKGNRVKVDVDEAANNTYRVRAYIGESYETSKIKAERFTLSGKHNSGSTTPPPSGEDGEIILPSCEDNPVVDMGDLSYFDNPNLLSEELTSIENVDCRMIAYMDEIEKRTQIYSDRFRGMTFEEIRADPEYRENVTAMGESAINQDPDYSTIQWYDGMFTSDVIQEQSITKPTEYNPDDLKPVVLVFFAIDDTGTIKIYYRTNSSLTADEERFSKDVVAFYEEALAASATRI